MAESFTPNKEKILKILKEQEDRRQAEMELSGKKPTKTDIKRRRKITEIEREIRPGKMVAGGLAGGAMLFSAGCISIVIGLIISITIVGLPVGLVLFFLGVLLIIISLIIGGAGVISGIISAVANRTKKRK